MNVVVAAFVGFLIVQISHPSEGKTTDKCITTSIPDIFDLSKCVKGYTDLCSKKTKGVLALAVKVLECLIEELPKVDLSTQVYIIVQFIEYLLDRATLGLVSGTLEALCKAASEVAGLAGAPLPCHSLKLNKDILCTGTIKLKAPSSLNLGECFGDYLQTCKNKKPVTEPTLTGLIRVIACLVESALESSPAEEAEDLACTLVKLPATIIGEKAYDTLEPLVEAISQAFGIDCSSSVFC